MSLAFLVSETVKIEKMRLVGVSQDQRLAKSGNALVYFCRTTSRPPDLPKHYHKLRNNRFFLNSRFFYYFLLCFPPQKMKKRSPVLPYRSNHSICPWNILYIFIYTLLFVCFWQNSEPLSVTLQQKWIQKPVHVAHEAAECQQTQAHDKEPNRWCTWHTRRNGTRNSNLWIHASTCSKICQNMLHIYPPPCL